MDTKIRIEYTFNSLDELVKFLQETGKLDGKIVEKEERTIQDVLKEMNPNAVLYEEDNKVEQEIIDGDTKV